MAEDLDHLLAIDHLLDIAVQAAQALLLAHEVAPAAPRQHPGHGQHARNAENHNAGEKDVRGQHAAKSHQDCHSGVDHLGNALGEHLAQGVHVIGVNAHHVAVGMGVEVFDGQRLHVSEELIPNLLLHTLGDRDHQPVIGQSAQRAGEIQAPHHDQNPQQPGVIRRAHRQQRFNIIVNQGL